MLLSDFPQEIIEQIADYLSLGDKISCSLMCKSWKRAFQDTLYSDISICSHEALQAVMTPSQNSRPKYHEIGHLVRYLEISYYYGDLTAEKTYALQKTFPNIKYLSFGMYILKSSDFESMGDWNLWGPLTELQLYIAPLHLPAMESLLVEAIVCLPLLRRLNIHGEQYGSIVASFSVNDFETIHSHLNHLEYMSLNTNFLTLSDTDLERIPSVSPATTMKILDIKSNKADYRWLCYLSRKYPNIHTLSLSNPVILPDVEEQKHNTIALFQQVSISFKRLTKLNFECSHITEGGDSFFADKINFHDIPLKHMSIEISVPYGTYSPDNLYDVSKMIAQTCLEKCSKTIKSCQLRCNIKHATPINLTEMENNLYNLVKVDISIPTVADIDVFLRAAPRLKYLELMHADIKVKDELYNSERFELQSFSLFGSTITSDVLRFLSFHCRKLNTLTLVDTSVYGKFTTPGCQFIDMTYSRLQTVSMSKTRFIIKDYKECPDNLNITLITRPVDDIPPKQEYDPSNSSVDVGYTHFKTHDEWFHTYNPHRMITISKLHASYITNFVSNYEENKRVAMEEARQLKRRKLSRIWKQNFVFGYTKIDLGYITNYSCSTSLY